MRHSHQDLEFENQDLQNYYNTFVTNGSISQDNALQIGATIEDLDIVDLERFITETTNTEITDVFNSLQCGSRNHLRSFVSSARWSWSDMKQRTHYNQCMCFYLFLIHKFALWSFPYLQALNLDSLGSVVKVCDDNFSF